MALSRRWHRRRINNPATLTRHVRTPASHLHPSRIRRPKHFGRIICSTRFDTRVSVVSYLRSNVAPSTRARARAREMQGRTREKKENKKERKEKNRRGNSGRRCDTERRRHLGAFAAPLHPGLFVSEECDLFLIPCVNANARRGN